MATTAETNSSQMERLTTCPVCLDKFRSPKLLPCMHTFCLTPCLVNLVDPRARSLRCPECRRDHVIPPGGVQGFPANLTMIGFLDLQPSNSSQGDRCFVCQEQKPGLSKCHDCSKWICSDCREAHCREASIQIGSSVSQLRRTLPKLSDNIASYEQKVNNVRVHHEQIQREITSAIANLLEELKHRETALFTEAEVYMQSQLRMFRLQQETAEVELASVASFCEACETSFSSGSAINDVDLANMRAQCQRYSQQIDTLQAQMPRDVHKLRFISNNQPALSSNMHDFGRLIDLSREQQPSELPPSSVVRSSYAEQPRSSEHYVSTVPSAYSEQYRQLEDLYYSRHSTATRALAPTETFPYRRSHNHFSGSVDNPLVDLSFTTPNRPTPAPYRASWDRQSNRRSTSIFGSNPFAAPNPRPPEPTSRRNHVTSTNAGRSLDGDARPILGGARERSRPNPEPIEEQEAPLVDRPRRNTFVLDEPSLPDLPQSVAQRPRDTVNVHELYNVRPRDRAQTPVTFTININETSSASNPSPSDGTH